jgi:hypothetical protein
MVKETRAYMVSATAYDPEVETDEVVDFVVFAKSIAEVERKVAKELGDFFQYIVEITCLDGAVPLK